MYQRKKDPADFVRHGGWHPGTDRACELQTESMGKSGVLDVPCSVRQGSWEEDDSPAPGRRDSRAKQLWPPRRIQLEGASPWSRAVSQGAGVGRVNKGGRLQQPCNCPRQFKLAPLSAGVKAPTTEWRSLCTLHVDGVVRTTCEEARWCPIRPAHPLAPRYPSTALRFQEATS